MQDWPNEKCCEKHKILFIGDEHTINTILITINTILIKLYTLY